MEYVALYLHPSVNNKKDSMLSLNQFEEQHHQKLKTWLVEKKYCLPKEANYCSTLVLEQLKKQYSGKKPYHLSYIWEIIHKFTTLELSKVKKAMEKNFGLTESGFKDLLVSLQHGDDTLVEQLFLSHFEDCMRYLQRNYRASHEDAYDTTMETMLEFIKRLKAEKVTYGNLRFLFTQMAGQMYIKWIKKESVKSQIEGLEIGEAPENIDAENLQILNKAWEGLCNDCKDLLKKYYYDGVPLNAMADLLDKSPAALRKQKQRCVEKLRGLFAQNV